MQSVKPWVDEVFISVDEQTCSPHVARLTDDQSILVRRVSRDGRPLEDWAVEGRLLEQLRDDASGPAGRMGWGDLQVLLTDPECMAEQVVAEMILRGETLQGF